MKEDLVPYYKWCYGKFILVGYTKKDQNENKNRVRDRSG